MKTRRIAAASLVLLALALLPGAVSASQLEKPAWKITSVSLPTNFAPGSEGTIFLVANNLGAKPTAGPITITDEVPDGLEIVKDEKGEPKVISRVSDPGGTALTCLAPAQTVTCTGGSPIRPGYQMEVRIFVKAPPAPETALNKASISGGGGEDAITTSPVVVDPKVASFGFLAGTAGLDGPFTDPDGAAAVQAGSHPYQLTLDLGFPTKLPGGLLASAGHLRDATVDLPRGVIIDPAASPVLCTEAQLITDPTPGCPAASQVGTVSAITIGVTPEAKVSPLYNMVPPPGEAAALGFDALGVGVFVHVLGGVRSDGDYGLSGGSTDTLASPAHPVFGVRVDLWGEPSDESHDGIRGICATSTTAKSCPMPEPTDTALLTMPSECSGAQLKFEARADSWEVPGVFEHAEYGSADLAGNPAKVKGCNQLSFEPSIEARPTTSLADSPSGLDVTLKQPQDFDHEGLSTSALKDAAVTLPAGLAVNAAQADGLEACTSAQIGLRSGVGGAPVRFSKDPAACPEAAKLGTVEVTTPLLAQIDDENKVQRDPGGEPIPEPLHGFVYVAKPFDNPFDSLLAIYLTVEDAKTGIVAKLAGKVEPDPLTGQLTTRFTENPQLPLSEARVHLFTGSRAPLQTPPTCGKFTTTTDLTPWSSPDIPDAHPDDSFALTGAPSGGACPASEAQAPNAPSFTAGTVSPVAATYSPLALKLSREDGSQRLARLEATLPAGLSAKLAGVRQCSEAQIAAAQARSQPNEGAAEKASPSCPAASEVGVVNAGAGAGPNPLYIQGHAYLAGPYKGAPLSVVVITPAVAGPFDLGVVVVRTALYLDPTSAQVRAVSDPFPAILHGIPVDLRSVALRVDRPQFSLNPTSCDPKSFSGAATSTLGQIAPLSERFQLGGCERLPFKPKLGLRLFGPINRGAHPRLRAILTAKPGEANIAATSVALPHSEFIDQGHFRTICTRVQFAAAQCPAGSVYGHITAISPLLDYALEGPIYLRSSSHKLPDVVAALKGPPSQPLEVDLVGRVDSVNGGIRTRFETVPDAPVTKAIVTLQGGKKGLFQNSTNICRGTHRVTVKMDGQNGKVYDTKPVLKASCAKKGKKGRQAHKGQRG